MKSMVEGEDEGGMQIKAKTKMNMKMKMNMKVEYEDEEEEEDKNEYDGECKNYEDENEYEGEWEDKDEENDKVKVKDEVSVLSYSYFLLFFENQKHWIIKILTITHLINKCREYTNGDNSVELFFKRK